MAGKLWRGWNKFKQVIESGCELQSVSLTLWQISRYERSPSKVSNLVFRKFHQLYGGQQFSLKLGGSFACFNASWNYNIFLSCAKNRTTLGLANKKKNADKNAVHAEVVMVTSEISPVSCFSLPRQCVLRRIDIVVKIRYFMAGTELMQMDIHISKGFKQCCCLYPTLFEIFRVFHGYTTTNFKELKGTSKQTFCSINIAKKVSFLKYRMSKL